MSNITSSLSIYLLYISLTNTYGSTTGSFYFPAILNSNIVFICFNQTKIFKRGDIRQIEIEADILPQSYQKEQLYRILLLLNQTLAYIMPTQSRHFRN